MYFRVSCFFIFIILGLFPQFCLAEGAFELRDGNSANLPIRIINAGGAPTYMRIDILDPTTEVIDIYTENIGSPDIRIWCPGQIAVDAAAQSPIPAPDFTADVTAAQGQVIDFPGLVAVQNIATRPIPPVTYNLSGPTATCGSAGTYTIRISNNTEYFDFAVRDTSTNTIERGRLFSYFWGFNGRTFNNFFRGTFFVVSGADFNSFYEGLVWEMDLNGIRPFVFEMLSNSVGVQPSIYNSKSVNFGETPQPVLVPEFPLYVNQPEKEVRGLPTIDSATLDLDFDLDCDGDATITGLDFSFMVPGAFTYRILVDENMDGVFSPGEQVLAGPTSAGVNTIPWNAILPSGAPLPPGVDFDYRLDITGGEVHFPFRDVEFAIPGPLITLQGAPGGAVSNLYFWDDTDPSVTSTAGGGSTSLPAGSLTEHQWQNGVDGYLDQNIIDTWKFDTVEISTSSATATCPIEVDLEILKSQSPSTLVPGTPVSYTVEVVNNGVVNVTGANVADTLDPRLTNVVWTCSGASGASCANASGTGNLSELEDIPVGGVLTYTITADIPADATGTLSNTAQVRPPSGIPETDPDNNEATVSSPLTPQSDLVISKTHTPIPFVAGSPGQWIISVVNNGPSDAPGVLVNDTFPAGFSGPTWTCAVTGSGTCSNASGSGDLVNESIDLDVGASAQFLVSGTIPAGGSGSFLNTATLSHPNDTDPGNNTAPDNATIDLINDIVVAKSHSPAVFIPGSPATYIITVSNAGPSNSAGITFVDNIPPELLSAAWTCAVTTGTGSCSTGSGTGNIAITMDLDVGATATVTINGTIDPTTTGPVNNSTSVSHPDDDNPGNNTDTTTTNVDPQVDLVVLKTLTTAQAVAGQSVGYDITVTNNGPSFASAVSVIDNVPTSILSASWTCAVTAGTGACSNASGTGSIGEIVDLAPTSSITFSLTGTIDPTACGDLSNTAAASSLEEIDPANNSSTVNDTIVKLADLSLTKTHTPEPVVPGSPVTYTVTVSNAGPAAVFGASFVDNLPPELLVPTWTCSVAGTGVCSAASGSGNISETLDLAPGASAIFTITGTVDQTVTSAFSNSAEVTPPPGVTDPDDSNNEAEDEAEIDVQVDLEVLKSVSPANPVPGLPFTWSIEITNAGPSAANNFTFSDNFPPEALSPAWTCSVSGVGSCPAASGTGDIVNVLMSLNAASSAVFTVTATLDPNFAGTMINSATASSPDETDPSDNTGEASSASNVQVDLQASKTASPSPFVAGSPASWILEIESLGPSNVDDVVVMDALPIECLNPTWTCSIVTGAGNCDDLSGSGSINTTLDLDAGAVAQYEVNCLIDPSHSGTSSNSASISHPDDVFGPNNLASETVPVILEGDVRLVKSHNPDPLVAGQAGSFTVEVFNDGPSNLTGISVVDNLPPDLLSPTWTCSVTGTGLCSNASGSGNINETVDLNSGSVATFLVSGTISPSTTGISNTASASHPNDSDDSNNSDTDSSVPEVLVDLVVGKTHSPSPFVAGEPAQYSFQITNNGPSDAVGVSVTDTLPAAFAGAAWTCNVIAGSGLCTNISGTGDISESVDIAVGGTIEYVISTTLSSSLTGVVENTVDISHPGDTTPENNSADDQAPVDTLSGISIDKTHSPLVFIPGNPVQYSLTVTNAGPSDALGTSVVDTLPTALLNANWSCAGTGAASCGNASGAGDINELVDLPAGTTVTFIIDALLDPAQMETVINSASADHPSDSDTSNNSVDDSANIDIQADVSITKVSSPVPAIPGSPISYSIQLINNGPSLAAGVVVSDSIPATVLGASWTCSVASGTGSCGNASGAGSILESVDIGPGSIVEFLISGTVDPAATGDVVNTAIFDYPNDSTPGDESATDLNTLDPITNIVATKVEITEEFITGETVAYELTVTNNGPSNATGVLISDPLDPLLLNPTWSCSVLGSTAVPGSCSTTSGLGDVAVLADLAVGSTATIVVEAELSLDARDAIANTLFVEAPEDPDPTDNSPSISTAVMNLNCGVAAATTEEWLPWNGFLDQTNIITLQNNCGDQVVDAIVEVFDIDGNVIGSTFLWIDPNSQQDLIVNDLDGFESDSYGNLQLSYSAPGCIDSYVAYYGLDDQGNIAQQSTFVAAAPMTGTSYANYNTFQPSVDPADFGAPMFNWLQVRNLDAAPQTFTRNLYDSVGNLVDSVTFTVPPLGRIDVQAGHENPGPSNAGLVELIPAVSSAQYLAEIAKYGLDGNADLVFTYASPLGGGSTSVCEWVNISSGAGVVNWLTLSNTGPANLTATVKLVDQSAPSAATTTSFLVEPFGQRAVLASGDLAPGASGFAEVCTTNGGSFRAESVFYYYGLDGSVASVVQEDSRLGRCDMSFSSYNTFLSQDNWLRVTNPGEDPIVIEIETFDLTGALIGASSQNIAPSQGLDLNLVSEFSLASDNYGQIKVNVLTSNGGFVVGDVLRVNFGPDGTVVHAEVYPLD